ncbi:MAG: DinB family protein [Reichenbachiella sp.]|uniref:DinB family protein n=1 Tax=Reichenbachiella sp. TaxID=2184521 RepID=UPI003263E36D
MKTISLMMLALVLMSAGSNSSLSKKEIKYSTKYLDSSMSLAFSAVENISTEQWNYQPDVDTWSIAGICEHMLIAEKNILVLIQNKIITDEANRNVDLSDLVTNEDIILGLKDRGEGKRRKTNERFEPTGALKTPAQFMKEYQAARQATVEFIKTTEINLNDYYWPSPLGNKLSAYQWTILLSAHAERHTAQIVEVQSSDGYPM